MRHVPELALGSHVILVAKPHLSLISDDRAQVFGDEVALQSVNAHQGTRKQSQFS